MVIEAIANNRAERTRDPWTDKLSLRTTKKHWNSLSGLSKTLVCPLILGKSKRGRHESTKRIDDFMGGLELKQIRKPRDDSIIESYRMGKISWL